MNVKQFLQATFSVACSNNQERSLVSQSELVFLPLGGVGEIGMNMALYGVGPATDRQWMIVDCGKIGRAHV